MKTVARMVLLYGIALLSLGASATLSATPIQVQVNPTVVVRSELPPAFFGFNIHQWHFQDELTTGAGVVRPHVTAELSHLPSALYRYPGGLLANVFAWPDAYGPVPTRNKQKLVKWSAAQRVTFGLEQYLDFVIGANGMPWIVVNLVGWHADMIMYELPSAEVAKVNAEVARRAYEYLLEKGYIQTNTPLYFELGNELDRAKWEWPHEKYIARAQETVAAIEAVVPNPRFVAFLRDFDWRYKDPARKGQFSRMTDLVTQVLNALPQVQDFSLHYYYDDPGLEHKNPKKIPWRLRQFRQTIAAANKVRPGMRLWVTEHARGVNLTQPKPMSRAHVTSNYAAALSVADFLGAMAVMPAIQGAALHGLNAGPWQVFDATAEKRDLSPRATLGMLKHLYGQVGHRVVTHQLIDRAPKIYADAYSVRATVFADEQNQYSFWLVNRDNRARQLVVGITGQSQPLQCEQVQSMVGAHQTQPGRTTVREMGGFGVTLPSRSVTVLSGCQPLGVLAQQP